MAIPKVAIVSIVRVLLIGLNSNLAKRDGFFYSATLSLKKDRDSTFDSLAIGCLVSYSSYILKEVPTRLRMWAFVIAKLRLSSA